MRHFLCTLLFLALLGSPTLLRATDDPKASALQTADDARVAAFIAADAAALSAILSDDLRYAHSSGNVDTKASLIEAMKSGKLKYTGITYDDRSFSYPAPGMALMFGKVRLQVLSGGGTVEIPASYLAVWREEKGTWHFLAWQSAKLPAPAPAAK